MNDSSAERIPLPGTASEPVSPVPEDVAVELHRLRERWAQLPLALARDRLSQLRRALDQVVAGDPHREAEMPASTPELVIEQLTVATYDACARGESAGIATVLAECRHTLH